MIITPIVDISRYEGQIVTLQGWLYNKRSSKTLQFLQIRDGSGIIQAVVSKQDVDDDIFNIANELTQESSLSIEGTVRAEIRSPIGFEIQVQNIKLIHQAINYPITKKEHGDAFLMDHRHLWLRSPRQHAIMRIRHTIIKAIRDYFDDNGFTLIDSPILTPNACEGTTTLFSTPYFDTTAFLTQSGQLYQEAAAMAFGKSYCFGPTFRAEKSKTRRHLTEFWMVEPEVAFLELDGLMDLAEDFLVYIVSKVMEKHEKELIGQLKRDIAPLLKVQKPFTRLSYDKALKEIQTIQEEISDPELKNQLAIHWGDDFGSPHETELTKRYDRPLMVYGFPASVKAFYMKRDPENPDIARCVDVLAPEGYGEIIGGGQREDNLKVLENAISKHNLPQQAFSWFLDLRRYGSVPHAGFGLGIERTVAWICGLHHVRETIPFARLMDRLSP
ncbi:MAG: asparagine--tRNA ligase [Deltaproteobacteria bacterium]|nr:asparagine--tRNA ligase [Deltaproteobacteria bacterium]